MPNATTTERHPIPPIVCTPGCEYGDGRPDALFRGEQTCWGPRSYVDLSLEEVNHDDSGLYMPRIGVMAYTGAGRPKHLLCTSTSTALRRTCAGGETPWMSRWTALSKPCSFVRRPFTTARNTRTGPAGRPVITTTHQDTLNCWQENRPAAGESARHPWDLGRPADGGGALGQTEGRLRLIPRDVRCCIDQRSR